MAVISSNDELRDETKKFVKAKGREENKREWQGQKNKNINKVLVVDLSNFEAAEGVSVGHKQKMWWQRLEVAAVAICAKMQAPPRETPR